MIKDLNKLWESLISDKRGKNSGLLLRKLHSLGLHVGFDLSSDQKVLLLELENVAEVKVKKLPKWKGIKLEISNLDSKKEAILIRLLDDECTDIFNALIKDIDDALASVKKLDAALVLFIDCLNRWKSFFEKYGSNILRPELQRGLYGELFFLKNHAFPKMEIIKALESWRGHGRKHQDFVFPAGNVEVKTTIKKEHKTVVINSEKQLDDSSLASLYLYCLALDVTENKSQSLPQAIRDIRKVISVTTGANIVFNHYLIQAGYLDEHEQYYDDNGYVVKKEYMYKVEEGFPRIITLPNGTGDLKYSIALSACNNFEANINSAMQTLVGEKGE